MATRLTGFSKLVITLLILALIFFGGKYVLENTQFGQDIKKQADEASTTDGSSTSTSDSGTTSGTRDPKTLRVQLVTWGGYAPGLYFNEGANANENSRFFKDYGFKVEFKVENDLINANNDLNKLLQLPCLVIPKLNDGIQIRSIIS